jgi:hypothetical protein
VADVEGVEAADDVLAGSALGRAVAGVAAVCDLEMVATDFESGVVELDLEVVSVM